MTTAEAIKHLDPLISYGGKLSAVQAIALARLIEDARQAREILTLMCKRYRAGGFGLWDTVETAEAWLATPAPMRGENSAKPS